MASITQDIKHVYPSLPTGICQDVLGRESSPLKCLPSRQCQFLSSSKAFEQLPNRTAHRRTYYNLPMLDAFMRTILAFLQCLTYSSTKISAGLGLNRSVFAAMASRRSPFFRPVMIFTIASPPS